MEAGGACPRVGSGGEGRRARGCLGGADEDHMPDVGHARASQVGHRWGAGSGCQARSLSQAGLCPVPLWRLLVQ
eukprot:15453584-Alexandrium_andersonii.AAC.1